MGEVLNLPQLLRAEPIPVEVAYEQHIGTIYRIAYTYLKNAADAEDAASETFIRLMQSRKNFASDEHTKAWLIRVAVNLCKDKLKAASRKTVPLDAAQHAAAPVVQDDTLDAVLDLPAKYKTVVVLYYYEGYDTAEIAKMLKKPHSTIRNQLCDARRLLKTKIGGL